VLEPKVNDVLLLTVVKVPALVVNKLELNEAEPPLTLSVNALPKSVPTLNDPPVTLTVPVKELRVPPNARVPPELNVPLPPR